MSAFHPKQTLERRQDYQPCGLGPALDLHASAKPDEIGGSVDVLCGHCGAIGAEERFVNKFENEERQKWENTATIST
jgi:hypothetical protein